MDSDDQGQLVPSAALLLIIGEPFSEDQKTLILAEITKGFRCWDVEDTGININEELAQIANRASLGEEGASGERFIQHNSDNLAVEILINPLSQSVKNSIKKLLIAQAPTKYIIYAGHAFQGTGAWVLQDDTFAFSNLAQVFKNVDVENALKQNIEANLTIHTLADTNWGTCISRADFTNHLRIQLNPPEKLDNIHGVLQFTAYVGSFVKVVPITNLLQASEQFGNISFTRPTLYIFPGCQGDSALFGINGFNLLVNGGYNRRACFWDFARHLDRVDAMLMTHLGTDNIFGLNTVIQRKSLENIHPQIGYLYFNVLDKIGSLAVDGEGDGGANKTPSLLINLAEEANKMTQMAKMLGISPQPCTRNPASVNSEPVNLYHKLGHGSLDMYVLNPVADTKELKEFYQAWSKQSANLGTSGIFPLQNVLSVCTLLVWKPYNLDEKIVRIFFPGNAPQHKIIEGLEKMKNFGFLKSATCTSRDLIKPPPVKKPVGGSARPASSSGRTTTKASTSKSESGRGFNTTRVESPRKLEPKAPIPKPESRTTSPTKPVKAIKEENNKKTAKAKEKAEVKEKPKADDVKNKRDETKAKPASRPASAAAKAPSPTKSPSKSPSPPKTPLKSPTKTRSPTRSVTSPSKTITEPPQPLVELSKPPEEIQVDQKPEADAIKAMNALNDTASLVKENNSSVDPETCNEPVSSSVDKCKDGDLINHHSFHQNGVDNSEEEEIKPQALPEPPVIIESPSQESDTLPDYSSKIESDEQELSEFSRAEEELKEIENSFADPAQEIPSSPEPIPEELHEFQYPSAVEPPSGFETPVFTHEVLDPAQPSMEQNIQYGIDDLMKGRDMGGIQEVDEEQDEEDEVQVSSNQDINLEKSNQEKSEDNEERDEEDEAASASDRASVERQFEDVEDVSTSNQVEEQLDEGIVEDDQSSLPAAFDRDSSPENGDRDSLDGEAPDDDKDIDETSVTQKVNGVHEHQTEDSKSYEGGVNKSIESNSSHVPSDSEDGELFDPVQKWGPPMGLPSPPVSESTSPQKSSRPATASKASKPAAATSRNGSDPKKRPATAPATARSGATRATSAKRPGTGSSRSSPLTSKTPPLPPMTAFYVDLTYIPNHGDSAYSDAEFFKRVRARYYVLSSMSPNPQILDCLMEAKATWEQKDLEVTLIPTYDNETLRHWVGLNKEKLQELRIDLTPAVSRCTIQLQDLETSLPAYRLEV
ncbi:microtubule-associated protein futsch-like isoform X2 [Physella acuta]|uniref:microtubule-associated protein futsch-like isoform X2 n=1 Tax=Physella acuta TaxID=109671 RepID=UPI0027DC250E|nr:microtubule-associated protein futsch-like isoform X2 [Physella acuta]